VPLAKRGASLTVTVMYRSGPQRIVDVAIDGEEIRELERQERAALAAGNVSLAEVLRVRIECLKLGMAVEKECE
jgi:hypothetical protein